MSKGETEKERNRGKHGWTAYLFDLLAALISHVIQRWIRRSNDVGSGYRNRRGSNRGWLDLSMLEIRSSILIFGFRLILARNHVALYPGWIYLLFVSLFRRHTTFDDICQVATRDERAGQKDDQYHGQESADRQPLHQPHLVQALAALPQAARSCRCCARIGGAVCITLYLAKKWSFLSYFNFFFFFFLRGIFLKRLSNVIKLLVRMFLNYSWL